MTPSDAGIRGLARSVRWARDTGGRGGRVERAAGRILQKPTNAAEQEFYRRMRRGEHPALHGIVPDSFAAKEVFDRDRRAGGDDALHVFVENIAHGMRSPKLLDIKIGTKTASRKELTERGMGEAVAQWKKRRLTLADVVTRGLWRGYRVVAMSGVRKNRLVAGFSSEKMLRSYCDDPALYRRLAERLRETRRSVSSSALAMIASSVLVAWDQDGPGGECKVTLIDFAHTFGEELGADLSEKYRTRFDRGMEMLIADVEAIATSKAASEA